MMAMDDLRTRWFAILLRAELIFGAPGWRRAPRSRPSHGRIPSHDAAILTRDSALATGYVETARIIQHHRRLVNAEVVKTLGAL